MISVKVSRKKWQQHEGKRQRKGRKISRHEKNQRERAGDRPMGKRRDKPERARQRDPEKNETLRNKQSTRKNDFRYSERHHNIMV